MDIIGKPGVLRVGGDDHTVRQGSRLKGATREVCVSCGATLSVEGAAPLFVRRDG